MNLFNSSVDNEKTSGINMNEAEHQEATACIYKYQVKLLGYISIWALSERVTPTQRRLYHLRFGLSFLFLSGFLMLSATHLVRNINQLQVILGVFYIFSSELSCLAKFLSVKLKNRQHARLIALMHSATYRPRNRMEFEQFEAARVTTIKVRNLYFFLSILAVNLMLLMQLVVDGTKLPLSMYEPCDTSFNGCYYGLFIFQYVSVGGSCLLNIAFDSLAFSLLFYVQAQLGMLTSRLEHLGEATTPADNQRIAQQLRACIVYNEQILKLQSLIEGFIRVPGSVQIICSMLVMICNLYDITLNSSASTALLSKTITYQLAMFQQIFMVCYAANELTLKSQQLSYALYRSQWQTWDKPNRRICFMMMQRFQVPILVRTINPTYSFSLAAFTSIVNTSYSYYALIKRMNS